MACRSGANPPHHARCINKKTKGKKTRFTKGAKLEKPLIHTHTQTHRQAHVHTRRHAKREKNTLIITEKSLPARYTLRYRYTPSEGEGRETCKSIENYLKEKGKKATLDQHV